jgi:hypothetical protein
VQPALTWVNQDPADIWWEILTVHLGIPSDRIGRSDVGTTGRQRTAAARSPTARRATPRRRRSSKVTLKLTDAETGDTLIDQLSFIMGGTTIEIAGQIVFRQIYPLRDAAGRITVAPDPVAAVFDARDYTGLETPTGREQRITVLACDYGVDTTAAAALPTSTANLRRRRRARRARDAGRRGAGHRRRPAEIAAGATTRPTAASSSPTQLAQQVVLATSTGLRLWPWNAIDAHPELTVGDTVVLITDQYTDWDPARRTRRSAGMNAYPLTHREREPAGKRFRGFLQGLAGVANTSRSR